jgi:hypothetical protein
MVESFSAKISNRKYLGYNKSSHWSLFDLDRVRFINSQRRKNIAASKGKTLFRLVKSLFNIVPTFK